MFGNEQVSKNTALTNNCISRLKVPFLTGNRARRHVESKIGVPGSQKAVLSVHRGCSETQSQKLLLDNGKTSRDSICKEDLTHQRVKTRRYNGCCRSSPELFIIDHKLLSTNEGIGDVDGGKVNVHETIGGLTIGDPVAHNEISRKLGYTS